MAYDEGLAQRIREMLGTARITEKKMFGGLAFLSRATCSWESWEAL